MIERFFFAASWSGVAGSRLPAIVRERLVGFRHLVGVVLFLDRVAFALAGGDYFGGEFLRHRFLVAVARIENQPTHRQRGAAVWTHFHRDLISRPTDTSAFHFDSR